MKIVRVDWLSKEAEEAEIQVSDGENKALVFSCPFQYKLGEDVSAPLSAVFCKGLVHEKDRTSVLSRIVDSPFGCHIAGEIISVNEDRDGIVQVFGFQIRLRDLPKEFKPGDFVRFSAGRLDLY